MGRELKRVALDFNWPLGKVWKGFQNPHYKPCPLAQKECFRGYTAAGQWVEGLARFIAMLGAEALKAEGAGELQRVHPFVAGWEYAPHRDIPQEDEDRLRGIEDHAEHSLAVARYFRSYVPKLVPLDRSLATFVEGLAKKPPRPGFELFEPYAIEKHLLEAAGLSVEWLLCKVCKGTALDPAVEQDYDAWKPEGPPAGPGYQVWETVSEGSPVSPVFADPDALIDWLCQPGDKSLQGYSRKAAEQFVKGGGYVPSALIRGGKLLENIEAAGEME